MDHSSNLLHYTAQTTAVTELNRGVYEAYAQDKTSLGQVCIIDSIEVVVQPLARIFHIKPSCRHYPNTHTHVHPALHTNTSTSLQLKVCIHLPVAVTRGKSDVNGSISYWNTARDD